MTLLPTLKDLLLQIDREHIPNKTVLIRPRDKPWFTNAVRQASHKRDRAYTKWKIHPTPENYNTYKNLRHEANHIKAT